MRLPEASLHKIMILLFYLKFFILFLFYFVFLLWQCFFRISLEVKNQFKTNIYLC